MCIDETAKVTLKDTSNYVVADKLYDSWPDVQDSVFTHYRRLYYDTMEEMFKKAQQ